MDDVIALLVADLHLSLAPPVARSAEPDWLKAQARPLRQVRALAREHGHLPVIAAGDIFDRWSPPAEIINWAMDNLPDMYAVPGQHDLPMHSYDDIQKSAYWTLVKQGTIVDLEKENFVELEDVCLFGFPWGSAIRSIEDDVPGDKLRLAVIHAYAWIQGKQYPGASIQSNLSQYRIPLEKYSAAVFGDNHQGFTSKCGNCQVINCGCLIPRKSDERQLKPSVGLLHRDGSITQSMLDCSDDLWLDAVESDNMIEENEELNAFLKELGSVDSNRMDYRTSILRYLDDCPVENGVRKMVLEILGE